MDSEIQHYSYQVSLELWTTPARNREITVSTDVCIDVRLGQPTDHEVKNDKFWLWSELYWCFCWQQKISFPLPFVAKKLSEIQTYWQWCPINFETQVADLWHTSKCADIQSDFQVMTELHFLYENCSWLKSWDRQATTVSQTAWIIRTAQHASTFRSGYGVLFPLGITERNDIIAVAGSTAFATNSYVDTKVAKSRTRQIRLKHTHTGASCFLLTRTCRWSHP